MNSFKWLLLILNNKFKNTYILSIIGASLLVYSMRNNASVFTFNVICTGYFVLIGRCYFEKFVNNNMLTIFLLNTNIKQIIICYCQNVSLLVSIPILVFLIYEIILNLYLNLGEIQIILSLLLTCVYIKIFLRAYLLSLFFVKGSFMKIIEILIIIVGSMLGMIYMINEKIYISAIFIISIILLGYIYYYLNNFNKERIVRTLL